jgi:hypothetical protein
MPAGWAEMLLGTLTIRPNPASSMERGAVKLSRAPAVTLMGFALFEIDIGAGAERPHNSGIVHHDLHGTPGVGDHA